MRLSPFSAFVSLVITSLVAGCSGGANPSPSAPGVGSAPAGSTAASSSNDATPSATDPHLGTTQAMLDELDSVTDPSAIIAFAKTLPDVVGASLASDANSITIELNDQTPLIVSLTHDPRAGQGDPSTSSSTTPPAGADPIPQGIPGGGSMVLLNSLDASYGDPVGEIARVAKKAGYTTTQGTLLLDTLANATLLANASVVYVSTHGNVGDFNHFPQEFFFASSTCVQESGVLPPYSQYEGTDAAPQLPEIVRLIQEDATDLAPGCMASTKKGHTAVWGASRTFIENHVQLRANESLFIADACKSDSAGASAFKKTVGAKGAAIYAGWSDTTNDPGRVAPYFLDRIAGANTYDGPGSYAKESPPQRAFSATTIMNDMKTRGLDTAPNGAKFALTPTAASAADTDFGMLAPVVTMITSYAATAQTVGGALQQLAVTASVKTISGSSAPVFTWNGASVTIDHVISQATGVGTVTTYILNVPSGAAGGDLYVTVNGHDSNHVRITEYRGVIKAWSGNSSFTDTFVVNYHALAFAQSIRQGPHVEPTQLPWGTAYLDDSTVTYTAGAPSQGNCSRTIAIAPTLPLSQWARLPGVGYGFDPAGVNTQLQLNIQNESAVTISCPNVATETSSASALTSDFGTDNSVSADPTSLTISGIVYAASDADDDSLSIQPSTMTPVVGPAPDNAR